MNYQVFGINVEHLNTFKRFQLFHAVLQKTDCGAYQDALNTTENHEIRNDLEEYDENLRVRQLFRTQYREIGLVASSERVTTLIHTFLVELYNSDHSSSGKGKGKSIDFVSPGLKLANECFESRNYQNSIRVVQLLIEQCLLKGDVIIPELESLHSNSLVFLLQNVIVVD